MLEPQSEETEPKLADEAAGAQAPMVKAAVVVVAASAMDSLRFIVMWLVLLLEILAGRRWLVNIFGA